MSELKSCDLCRHKYFSKGDDLCPNCTKTIENAVNRAMTRPQPDAAELVDQMQNLMNSLGAVEACGDGMSNLEKECYQALDKAIAALSAKQDGVWVSRECAEWVYKDMAKNAHVYIGTPQQKYAEELKQALSGEGKCDG